MDGNAGRRRCIGLDVHREFAQVAVWKAGLVVQAGRIAATPTNCRSSLTVSARPTRWRWRRPGAPSRRQPGQREPAAVPRHADRPLDRVSGAVEAGHLKVPVVVRPVGLPADGSTNPPAMSGGYGPAMPLGGGGRHRQSCRSAWRPRGALDRAPRCVRPHAFGASFGRSGGGSRDVRRGAASGIVGLVGPSGVRASHSTGRRGDIGRASLPAARPVRDGHGSRRRSARVPRRATPGSGGWKSAEPNPVSPMAVATTASWWPMPRGPSLHPLMPAGPPLGVPGLPGSVAGHGP
jgi:hypothetical protein